MEQNQSQIGEYGYRLIPIDNYKTKKGKNIAPHWKKIKFEWKHN